MGLKMVTQYIHTDWKSEEFFKPILHSPLLSDLLKKD